MSWMDRLTAGARFPFRTRRGPSRPRIAVVTDSAAALPADWLASGAPAEGVEIVAMPVMIADSIFGDGSDELTGPLSVALAEGAEVRTSRPSPGQFGKVYRRLESQGYDGVLSIHLSAELSGTVEAARLAAGSVGLPVRVLDSRTVGMALGYSVAEALRTLRAGADLDAAVSAATSLAASSSLYFYVPSLEQLRRGGRIGAAAGLLGTLLSVKPILSVQNGRVMPLEKLRSAPKALARLGELVLDDAASRPGRTQMAVHYFGNPDQAREICAGLEAGSPGAEMTMTQLPAVLAAHTGLGVLAVAVADMPSTGKRPSDLST